jgi:hypothetical protein
MQLIPGKKFVGANGDLNRTRGISAPVLKRKKLKSMSQQGYSESAQVELKYNLLKSIEAKGYNVADE